MARILLIGATGQLGTAIQHAKSPDNWTFLLTDRRSLDLARPEDVSTFVISARPDAIINAAAYTAVDRAEAEPALAFALNRDGPAALVAAAANIGAPLVHISTDYVFMGDKPAPYVETDPRNPINTYGRSKAEGELSVLDSSCDAAVLRTSWVFSAHGSNFLKTMLRLGKTHDEVRVVDDQIGRPTAASELARASIEITQRLLDHDRAATGLFHFAGAGEASWATFAEAICDAANARGRCPVRVRRISTPEYPTPAARPANSRLDTSKIESFGIFPAPWCDGMQESLDELLR